MGNRQADRDDLLATLIELGVVFGRGSQPTIADARAAIREEFAKLHAALATLYPGVPKGVGALRNQQRLRALYDSAGEARMRSVGELAGEVVER